MRLPGNALGYCIACGVRGHGDICGASCALTVAKVERRLDIRREFARAKACLAWARRYRTEEGRLGERERACLAEVRVCRDHIRLHREALR